MENLLPPFKSEAEDAVPLSISHLHWKNINHRNQDQDKIGDGDKEISEAYARAKGKSVGELKEEIMMMEEKEKKIFLKKRVEKSIERKVRGGTGEYWDPETDTRRYEEDAATREEEQGENEIEINIEEKRGDLKNKCKSKNSLQQQRLLTKKKLLGPSPLSLTLRGKFEEMTEELVLPAEKRKIKLISYLTVLNGVDDVHFDIFAKGVSSKNSNNILHRLLPAQTTFTSLIYGNPLPLALPPHLMVSFQESGKDSKAKDNKEEPEKKKEREKNEKEKEKEIEMKEKKIFQLNQQKKKRQEEIQEFMYLQSFDKIETGLLLSFISELSLAQQERGDDSSYTVKFEPCLSLGLDLAFDKKLQLVYVHKVKTESQAEENGCIQKGDYVREIQGVHVTNLKQISLIAEARNKNELVSIRFERKRSKQRVAATKTLLSSFFQEELESIHSSHSQNQSQMNDNDSLSIQTTSTLNKEEDGADEEKMNEEKKEGKNRKSRDEDKNKEEKEEEIRKNSIAGKLLYDDENVLLAERTVLGNDATTTALMDGDNTNMKIVAKVNKNMSQKRQLDESSRSSSEANSNTNINTTFRLRKLNDIARLLTRSEEDDIPIIISFQNQSLRYNIKIGWVDYEGKRHGRNILAPGRAYMEQSYSTHPWLLRLEDTSICREDEKERTRDTTTIEEEDDKEQNTTTNTVVGPDHGLLLRIGIEAASAGACYTVLWNPAIKSTSIMGIQKADGGRLTRLENEIKLDPLSSDLSSYEDRKLRYKMQKLIQERRNNTDASLGGGKGMAGFHGPLVSIILIDKDPRLKI